MALPPLSITKNWFTSTVVREVNWDNIRTPLLDWAARINLAFGQTTVDAFGSSYTINSTGIPALAVSLQDQINAIIGGTGVLNSLTLINISDGATLTEFTSRWRSPTPAVNDAMIFSQTMNSDTTQDAIGTQFQFIATDVTHATRSSAIALLTMNSGTLAERFRVGPTGALGMISGQKIFLDGVTLAGNTSIRESAANTIMLETDGADRLALGPTGQVGIISGQKIFLDGVALSGDTSIRESAPNTIAFEVGGSDLVTLSSAGLNLLSTLPLFIPTTAPAADRSLALVSGILQAHDGTSAKSYLRTDALTLSDYQGVQIDLGVINDGAFADVDAVNASITFTVNVPGYYMVMFNFTVLVEGNVGTTMHSQTAFRLFDGTNPSVVQVVECENETTTVPSVSSDIVTLVYPFNFITTGSKTINLQKQNNVSSNITTRAVFAAPGSIGISKVAYRIADA